MTVDSRAIVVGGSLGGLMAASALRAVGCAVTVLERSPRELSDQGAGIRVQPAIERFFEQVAGHHADLPTAQLTRRVFIDESAAVTWEIAEEGATTHWGRLFESLRRCDHGDYRLGSAVVGFDQDDAGVTVRLADGDDLTADLLVFADGSASTGRRRLHRDVELEYAGYVAWRGAVPLAAVDRNLRDLLEQTLAIHVMPGSHIHLYPVPGRQSDSAQDRLVNFVWYVNAPDSHELDELLTDRSGRQLALGVRHEDLRSAALNQMHARAVGMLPAPLADVVIQSPAFVQRINDAQVARLASGRVALVGDAGFVARPHAGAGTAKAAENALNLARHLQQADGDVRQALLAWEPAELERGRDLVRRSRALGELYQVTGTFPGDPRLEELARPVGRLVEAPAQEAVIVR